MGNNGLIDPKPGFSPAHCFSGVHSNAWQQRLLPTNSALGSYSKYTKV